MNNPDAIPSQAPPLELPAAALNALLPEPHPDSEESIQLDRYRTAQELDVYPGDLGRRPSEISTVIDSLARREHHGRRYRHRLRRQVPHWYDALVKFWTTQVDITIDEGAHRDHLALERTFLAYLRTSLALVVTGVITAQLFRLQHASHPNLTIGFFVLGIPLATVFIGFGIIVLLIGAYRFWRQQNAMVRGKVYAGGWEITVIMVLSILVCTAAFALVTAIDVTKSYL
ncbi:hypothetical protein P280DRAFT_410070 [Massarina eburnea CBS 473.64]|uniref:DUF202 domain-containing protein n=1 Tax=Massarina eburnea CBS 473.64 TaxID=1395130 RepID=A0A6A6RNP3_9PLEO|nr:hypothetical protein P280DRAFT_410070 [Massarina eburnea CBS 473.64]